ncbi:indole-3-glycerol phosphate synthase TrpC [Acinetobacter sp. B5B]|uniref:indole-3-glycerol phosphate synthase TrpC n=1 Tax=Acinetobacter baretiae TaxID=2605383 RepID=UPI0018C30F07|nr:indole-3-glycerol phosphate synthase TrpC [Acinetobacter baretiae]MBF7682931.1 indole-3-glycerol phosphate synthase TrpC [Acinetobacter baretiae]MBF7684898.1 indole-3-glycerol phosphate synthase TrpC [Acinetobacter baretiae]
MTNIKNTILGTIIDRKVEELTVRQQRHSLYDLEQLAQQASPVRGFAHALLHKKPGVIAEIKKASPSKGIIRQNFNPAEIAQQYEHAGAACLSVLTDIDFFQGADENVHIARQHCHLPALRKDFLIDPYNVVESRAIDADCILLIVACLSNQQLEEMSKTAFEYGLDVLVEVHNEIELERALMLDERCLLGVNNRDLKTFNVDLSHSIRLKNMLPQHRMLITESGIATPQDVALMQEHHINHFLVGESFMKHAAPDQAFFELFGQPKSM